jgi:sugar phosphate isomerase/epimerase
MIAQPDLRSPRLAESRSLRTCFSSLGCPDFSLAEAASLALEHGVPCLELRALENRTDLPALLGEFPGGWAGAREYLRVRELQVQVLGTSFKLVGGDETGWNELLAFAELAEALQTPWLRAFGGGVWGQPLSPDDYQTAAENLRRWEAERRSRGWTVDILMETHDAFSASAPCLRLMEVMGRPIPLIWDSHHTWRLGGESPDESWEALAPCVKHVHWKDSIGVPSARHPFTYVLPGEGEMPIAEVMELLRRDDFSGAVSLEWEKLWHPYLPSLAEALRACRGGLWVAA